MANTRHDRAGDKSARPRRGPQAKMGARERIAAERAARKRAEARRRFLAAIAAVGAVLAVLVTLVAIKLTSNPVRPVASESQASSIVVRQITTVPAAAGLSAAQIASQLSNPSSPVAQAIDGSAQVIIAAINQVLHDKTVPQSATGGSGG